MTSLLVYSIVQPTEYVNIITENLTWVKQFLETTWVQLSMSWQNWCPILEKNLGMHFKKKWCNLLFYTSILTILIFYIEIDFQNQILLTFEPATELNSVLIQRTIWSAIIEFILA